MDIYRSDVNAMVVGVMKALFIYFFYILSSKLNSKISILLGAPGLQSPYLPITVGPLEVEIVISFFDFLNFYFAIFKQIVEYQSRINI